MINDVTFVRSFRARRECHEPRRHHKRDNNSLMPAYRRKSAPCSPANMQIICPLSLKTPLKNLSAVRLCPSLVYLPRFIAPVSFPFPSSRVKPSRQSNPRFEELPIHSHRSSLAIVCVGDTNVMRFFRVVGFLVFKRRISRGMVNDLLFQYCQKKITTNFQTPRGL